MSVVQLTIEGGVADIVLNRPRQLNAITVELGAELERAVVAAGGRDDVNVVAIRGSAGNFCAGGDFGEVERLRGDHRDGVRPLFENFADACRAVGRCPVPVIAVVEGVAMAGGFELMQAADICLVSDGARICDNHIRFGQIPGGGSTQRLPRNIGRQRAMGILLSGDRLSGRDAVRLGLAYASWPEPEFTDRAASFLATLAGRRRDATIAIKSLVRGGLEGTLDEGLDRELEAVIAHISGSAGGDGITEFSDRSRM